MTAFRLADPRARSLLEEARNGTDTEARFALADYLLSVDSDDERAELIVLQHRVEVLLDRTPVRRYLELLAKIGLGWLENDDEEQILFASGGGCAPVQYDLELDDFTYYVRYRHGSLSISDGISTSLDFYESYYACIEHRYTSDGGEWTDEETNVLLFEISTALREQRPHDRLPSDWRDAPLGCEAPRLALRLPEGDMLKRHPRFRKGPYPRYVAPSCGLRHRHEFICSTWTIRPYDYDRFTMVESLLPD